VRLRVEPLAEPRRVDHVGEDDGDRLAHLARRGRLLEREPTREAEPGVAWIRLATPGTGGHVLSEVWSEAVWKYTGRPVFDTLSDRLQAALHEVRGRGRLDEDSVSRAMREIRLALLEADVNFKVVKDFVTRVRARALGTDVTKSLTPGQEVVRIVHEELTELMGSGDSKLAFAGKPPTVILLAGLQGSGKTTAAAKLALLLRKEGHSPALVAADLQRPAAVDQLEQLGRQLQIPVFTGTVPVKAVTDGIEQARAQGRDVVILDTAGRLHVDEALMEELAAVRKAAKPTNVLLVLDAMTGQEAVSVAEAFQERVAFDGVVLTKLDGDARGGAALSVKAVTGKAIKLASVGEKLDQLEYFHPDRMASRILGMGDVLTLIEKAEAAVEEDEQARLEQQMLAGEFTFDDFLASYKMLRRMGPLKGVLSMIPGLGKQLEGLDVNERDMSRVEAIVLSMTPKERRMPHLIDGSRRKRIAAGSGTTVQQVNQLLSARKQMQKMMKQMKKGKMPGLPPELLQQAQRQGRR
jgi:signal recognition particle subunit SRP54